MYIYTYIHTHRALFDSHDGHGAQDQMPEENMGCVGEGRLQEQGMKGVLALPTRELCMCVCE